MSLSTLLLIFYGLIVPFCNATNKCLSFSGGGIRAAMGGYYTMNKIQKDGQLPQIKCISLISGGSWGFILWLFEDKPYDTRTKILNSMYEGDGIWGAKGPGELIASKEFPESWYDRWSLQIKKSIIDMTSAQGEYDLLHFDEWFRRRLTSKGLGDATIYFVVESVDSRIKKTRILGAGKYLGHEIKKDITIKRTTKSKWSVSTFIDYCWFKSTRDDGETFECSKDTVSGHVRPISKQLPHEGFNQIHLLDILNYCSSGWATAEGMSSGHRHTTKEFVITPSTGIGEESFRLIDAGGTFNDPLVPYMIDESYKSSQDVEIWNFDFSYFPKSEFEPGSLGNLFDFMRIRDAMERIAKPIPAKGAFLYTGASGDTVPVHEFILGDQFDGKAPVYTFTIDERIIRHYPLYGEYSKEKMIHYFPTMKAGLKGAIAKRWNMMEFLSYEREWTGHLNRIIPSPLHIPPPPIPHPEPPKHSGSAIPHAMHRRKKQKMPLAPVSEFRHMPPVPLLRTLSTHKTHKIHKKHEIASAESRFKHPRKLLHQSSLRIKRELSLFGDNYNEQYDNYYKQWLLNVINSVKFMVVIVFMIVSYGMGYWSCYYLFADSHQKKAIFTIDETQTYLDLEM